MSSSSRDSDAEDNSRENGASDNEADVHEDEPDSDSDNEAGSEPDDDNNEETNNNQDGSNNNGSEGGNDAHTAPSSGDDGDIEEPSAPFVYPAAADYDDDNPNDDGFQDEDPLLKNKSDENNDREEVGEEQPQNVAHDPMIKPLILFIVLASLLAIIIFPILFLVVLPNQHDSNDDNNERPTKEPSPQTLSPTTAAPTPMEWVLELPEQWKTTIQTSPTSSMAQAYQWVVADPGLRSYPLDRREQRFALAGLYYATGGSEWTRQTNWLDYSTAECLWEGVICDNSGDVTAPAGNATSTTAAGTDANTSNIFEQRNLRRNLQDSTTPAPGTSSESAQYDRIQSLQLADLQMKGTLPEEFSLLTDLNFLDLKDNTLMGSVPPLLYDSFVHLMEFNVRNNSLMGSIPSAIVKWSNLALLDVSRNQQFTNTLPSELGLLPAVYWLDVSHNQFVGGLPTQLGQLGLLQHLGMRGNLFNQTLPAFYGDMSSLKLLDAGENRIAGGIPPRLGEIPKLTTLFLDYNNLSGAVPNEIGPPRQNTLKQLDIAMNPLLTGVLPARLCYIELNFTCNPNEAERQLCGCGCSCGNGTDQVLIPPGNLTVPDLIVTPGPTTIAPTTIGSANGTSIGMAATNATAAPIGVGRVERNNTVTQAAGNATSGV